MDYIVTIIILILTLCVSLHYLFNHVLSKFNGRALERKSRKNILKQKLPRAIEKENWEEVGDVLEEAKARDTLQEILSDDKLVLLTAVSHNASIDIITCLIAPSTINVQNEEGNTALHLAIVSERWELVPVLLRNGADVNLSNHLNLTPLHLAADHGASGDIITSLISPHNINNKEGEDGNTALHVVLGNESWDSVPVLLEHGADINMCNDFKQPPLQWAAYFDAPADIVTRLISPHNINVQDANAETALHEAVSVKSWDLVPVLLQHGADINLCDSAKQTPLHLAAHLDAPADIITQLMSPLNINLQDKYGDTALHKAVSKKSWELVPLLLQHGADPFMLRLLSEPTKPLSLQSLTIATIRSHMPVKSDEAFEGLGLPEGLLPELKQKRLADEIVDLKPDDGPEHPFLYLT